MPGRVRDSLPEPVRVGLGRVRWNARWLRARASRRYLPRLSFVCNLCGRRTSSPFSALARELPSCGWCASTIRFRALMESFAQAVLETDSLGPDFPVRKDLRGLGFSDVQLYARHLARATDYTNSWFHRPPFHDVTRLDTFGREKYDYVVCSEVLEHIAAPIDVAVQNLFAILEPGGVLILSVPMRDGETVEHFPVLADYEIVREADTWQLRGTDVEGSPVRRDDLVFHGGPGATLEMRLVGRSSMRRILEESGFTEVRERRVERPELGIVWDGTPESIETSGGVVPGMHAGIWIARKPLL